MFSDHNNRIVFNQLSVTLEHDVEVLKELIISDLSTVVSDLVFLRNVLEENHLGVNRNKKNKIHYVKENYDSLFLNFSRQRKIYDQIRVIDSLGMETLRINYNNGDVKKVPGSLLQNKSNRYYFSDSIKLSPGEIYVSPLDLNVEHGEIESPLKPMLRFGMPFTDEEGEKSGIVLLNFFAQRLLNHFKQEDSLGFLEDRLFLNSEGYYFCGFNDNDAWGFMFPEKKENTLKNDFPHEWEQIVDQNSGQLNTDNGLFIFETVYITNFFNQIQLKESKNIVKNNVSSITHHSGFWKIVAYVPQSGLKSYLRTQNTVISRFSIIVSCLLVAMSFILSYFLGLRKVNRKKLTDLSLKLDLIVNASSDGIRLIDKDCNILLCNESYAKMNMMKRDEVYKKKCYELVSSGLCKTEQCMLTQTLKNANEQKKETVITTADGEKTHFLLETQKIVNKQNEVQGIVEYFKNIEAVKQLESSRVRNRTLESTAILAGGIAHDFNNILSIVMSNVELIDMLVENQPDLLKYTGNIHKELKRASSLANKFITFSNGGLPKTQACDLNSVLNGAVLQFEKQDSISFRIENESSVGKVKCDNNQLNEVFVSLFQNSLEAGNGSVNVVVRINEVDTISAEQHGSLNPEWMYCKISVKDNGRGISPEHLPHVFEPYYSTKQRGTEKGMGMGLSLVHSIIVKNQGEMNISSEVGKGTEVVIYFPLSTE